MFILRKLLKVLLLPVAFALFFIRWALEASVKLTEWAVGLLTLIVGAAIIYSIVIHRWGDLFLYSLIFAGIIAILMAVVVAQDFCSSMLETVALLGWKDVDEYMYVDYEPDHHIVEQGKATYREVTEEKEKAILDAFKHFGML